MRTPIVLALVGMAILILPLVSPAYHVTLMLPFMAYGVVLLGLNLLFGSAGLVSFGHALFIGIGAYTGAVLTTHLGVRHMELILPAAALAAAVVAAPVGALCVRYVKIYFGMLTLAFGMVFYTFLLKFYRLTGGDEGMRLLRPYLFGREWSGFSKTDYLIGPYYYFSLAVLVLATLLMWRIVRSPFGLCLRTIRDNPLKAESLGISVPRFRWYAFMISAVYAAVGGALLAPPTGNVDPTLAYWTHSGNIVFMVLLGGFSSFFGPLVGAFVVHLPAGHGHVGLPLLAAHLRRGAGLHRHLRAGRAHGPPVPPPGRRGLGPVILEARDVRKLYGAYVALDGVSLSVREGEFVSIIGPNGAGKSTLINVLTGVLRPSAGNVSFKGQDIGGIGTVALTRLGMARSFQLVQIFPELTVLETLQAAVISRLGKGTRFLSSLRGDRQVQADALEVAGLFGLDGQAHTLARTLPQGDKKLLDVASAFALRPEIILLDEPTSGVSTADKHLVMEILVGAAKRIGLRAIIQVEHDMDIVFGYSDRIIALHQGKVLADATPAEIQADARVVDMVVGRRRTP